MGVLRTEPQSSEHYKVYGRHSTLYAIQLPPWLPPHIMYKMLHRFEVYVSEVIRIIEVNRTNDSIKPPMDHIRGDSGQSLISIGSDSSEDSTVSAMSIESSWHRSRRQVTAT